MTITPAGISAGESVKVVVGVGVLKDKVGNLSAAAKTGAGIDPLIPYDSGKPDVVLATTDLTVNGNFTATATFSKPVVGLTAAMFTTSAGSSVSNLSAPVAVGTGQRYSFTVNIPATGDNNVTVQLLAGKVNDAYANPNNASNLLTVGYRHTKITPVLTGVTGYQNGKFNVGVAYTLDVTGLIPNHFTLNPSTDFGTPVLTGTGKAYTLAVTPVANKEGTVTIGLPANVVVKDNYGNETLAATAITVNYDTIIPVINSLTKTSGLSGAVTDAPFDIQVVFSEPVDPLTASGITVTNGTKGAITPIGAPVAGRYTTYKATITPNPGLAGGANLTIDVPAGATKDKANNPNKGSAESGKTLQLVFSKDAPIVTDYTVGINATYITNQASVRVDITSNGATANKNLLLNGANLAIGSDASSFINVTGLGATPYTAVVTTANGVTGAFSVTITPTGGFASGDYTISTRNEATVTNLETQKLIPSNRSFKVRIPSIDPGAAGFVVAPANHTSYVGGQTTVTIKGSYLNHSSSPLVVRMTDPTGIQTTHNVTITGGDTAASTATMSINLGPNLLNAAATYSFSPVLNGAVVAVSGTSTVPGAIPQVNQFTVAPTSFTYTGGSSTVTVAGMNLHNYPALRIERKMNGTASPGFPIAIATVSGAQTETFTESYPANTSAINEVYDYELVYTAPGGRTVLATQTVTVMGAVPTLDPNDGFSVLPSNIVNTGGDSLIKVMGINLHNYADLRVERFVNAATTVDTTYNLATTTGLQTLVDTAVHPPNFTAVTNTYTYNLVYGPVGAPIILGTKAVTVEPSVPSLQSLDATPAGTEAFIESYMFDNKGGTIDLTIAGQNLQGYTSLEIHGHGGPYNVTVAPTSVQTFAQQLGVALPGNVTMNDIPYTFEVYADGAATGVTITVTVQRSFPLIDKLSIKPEKFNQAGGNSVGTIDGKYLDLFTTLTVRNLTTGVDIPVTISTDIDHTSAVTGTINFAPWSQGLRNDIYDFEVYADGMATGVVAQVEIGDSLPNIQSADANPNYFPNVFATLNGKGKSLITIHGNYLFNYDSIQIYDRIYDKFYEVTDKEDMTATYTVTIPTAEGLFTYDIFEGGVQTKFSVQIGVGVPLGTSEEDLVPDESIKEEGKSDKEWKGTGGGSKGRGFTGRHFVGFDLLAYQCEYTAKLDPINPTVIVPDVFFITRAQIDLAASGAKRGTQASEKVGTGLMTLWFDTSREEDETQLEGRLSVRIDQPVPDLYPGVFTSEKETATTKSLFESRFDNTRVAVVSLGQNGKYGTKVEAVADVDLSQLDTESLTFYLLDRATGEYSKMIKPDYSIDEAGFIHFFTEVGGDIIITDKALAKESGTFAENS